MSTTLVIINNERVFEQGKDFYCDNLDLKVLPEGLNDYYKVRYIVRNSKNRGSQKINLKDIKVASSIFKFIYFVFQTLKIPNTKYLLISVTPYTFFSFLTLFLFRRKMFVYLMSSGHEEYKHILGGWSVWIFHLMYKIVTANSDVIVCHDRLFKKNKSHLISISRLDDMWFENHKKVLLDKVRFLYVGRMSPEKGIYDFLKMFNKLNLNAELSIASDTKNKQLLYPTLNNKINLLGYVSDPQTLINIYDNHNIMILPSFTEAYPYVVDESLSRNRPVIIFEDIEYIIKDKRGIFVSKRNLDSFSKTAKYIMQNYYEIQKDIEKNSLPTKQSMLKQISDILS